MVRFDVLKRFTETFGANGFRSHAFLPSYGLAESTLAVTFGDLEAEVRTETIDMRVHAESGTARPAEADTESRRTFVFCGRALPGHELEIRDGHGRVLEDRQAGNIFIRGA